MKKQQLEMGFQTAFRPCLRRSRRVARARWWFQQMREAVDRAWDWQSADADGTEQAPPLLSTLSPRN